MLRQNVPKTIKITCTGAATAKLEDLIPLQGDLKKLDAKGHHRLPLTTMQDLRASRTSRINSSVGPSRAASKLSHK